MMPVWITNCFCRERDTFEDGAVERGSICGSDKAEDQTVVVSAGTGEGYGRRDGGRRASELAQQIESLPGYFH
ncbi:hypothetical protein Q3G72_022105 [Acer saccharum]|nr:hypothetical protein Q3G72_022105 [Acer saccharum]